MKKLLYLNAVGVLLLFTGCTFMKPALYDGPALIPWEGPVPGVPSDVEYADYWIRTADDPDVLILKPEEIVEFNRGNPQNGEGIIDVLNLPKEIDGTPIRAHIAARAGYLTDATLYVTNDIQLEMSDRKRIIALMDTTGIPDVIPLRFGVMLYRQQGKNWPTEIPFVRSQNDVEFDATVGSAIDMGQPVALLHLSSDGRWSYIQNEMYTCWVHSEAVAWGDIETVRQITDDTMPVVAVGHRVSVYGNPDSGTAIGSIQMGTTLPLLTAGMNFCEVLIPGRGPDNELTTKKGYIRKSSDISIGFLPYTKRNLYRQCFTTFGRRYGWAGMFEERDCSRFTMDVFRCFGFKLPRTSGALLKASPAVLELEGYDREARLELLRASPGGITLVGWQGHIMVYLGDVKGTPYVIQATWSWREPTGYGTDITHRLARVLVGDIMMGDGSRRGPRIDRLTHITILGNYTFGGE